MNDILIIGAGTAGLSAALYAARAGKSVLVLEGNNCGGQIVNSPEVENYPGITKVSGYEFTAQLRKQAEDIGAKIESAMATELVSKGNIFEVRAGEQSYDSKALILACGAVNRNLGLEGEKRLTGNGVSYCAVCDGAFFKGRDVAVVGGGNTALEDAIFLSEYCNCVYVIHRKDHFRGETSQVNILTKKKNVTLLMETVVTTLCGDDKLKGIHIKNTSTNIVSDLQIQGLFVAIGQMPQNDWLGEQIEKDASGYIVANESCETNMPGVYVAGDCRTKKVRQLVTAASDGAVAAITACEYIEKIP